jgi:hypothetical protein
VKKEETAVVALTPQQEALHNNFKEAARTLKPKLSDFRD